MIKTLNDFIDNLKKYLVGWSYLPVTHSEIVLTNVGKVTLTNNKLIIKYHYEGIKDGYYVFGFNLLNNGSFDYVIKISNLKINNNSIEDTFLLYSDIEDSITNSSIKIKSETIEDLKIKTLIAMEFDIQLTTTEGVIEDSIYINDLSNKDSKVVYTDFDTSEVDKFEDVEQQVLTQLEMSAQYTSVTDMTSLPICIYYADTFKMADRSFYLLDTDSSPINVLKLYWDGTEEDKQSLIDKLNTILYKKYWYIRGLLSYNVVDGSNILYYTDTEDAFNSIECLGTTSTSFWSIIVNVPKDAFKIYYGDTFIEYWDNYLGTNNSMFTSYLIDNYHIGDSADKIEVNTGYDGLDLCFTAKTDGATISLKSYGDLTLDLNFQYSKSGYFWYTFTPNYTVITLEKAGDIVYIRGNNPNGICESENFVLFVMTGLIEASGNIMSLIDDGECTCTTIPNNYCFFNLFKECTGLLSTPRLPAITLTRFCYCNMFFGCTDLVKVSALPSITLAQWCYNNMFWGCASLWVNSTQLEECKNIWYIPNNGASQGKFGFLNMFRGCLGDQSSATIELLNEQKTFYTQNTITDSLLNNNYLPLKQVKKQIKKQSKKLVENKESQIKEVIDETIIKEEQVNE